MAKCIRCGKPCGSGENMCDECKAWFQEKTGRLVVPGVKNITSQPNKEVQADSKEQNNEQEKEKQVEVANQKLKSANAEKNNSIVISKKTLFIIMATVAIVMIAVVVLVLKQKENNTTSVAEIENFDNNDVANEDLGSEEGRNTIDSSTQVSANTSIPEVNSDFIIADSNVRYLSEEDVRNLSIQQVNYAKNEIYARHGRKFASTELQEYFNSKSWYRGTIDGTTFDANYRNYLNDYEIKNAEFLSSVEYSMDSNGYQLDQ